MASRPLAQFDLILAWASWKSQWATQNDNEMSRLDIKPLAASARRARSYKILRALTKFLRARLFSLSQFRINDRVGDIRGNVKTSPKCCFNNIFDRLGINTH